MSAGSDVEVVSLRGRVERLEEALTPSAETKAAYIGCFSITIPESDGQGGEYRRPLNVPWITIKEIMAAIRARAEATPQGVPHD